MVAAAWILTLMVPLGQSQIMMTNAFQVAGPLFSKITAPPASQLVAAPTTTTSFQLGRLDHQQYRHHQTTALQGLFGNMFGNAADRKMETDAILAEFNLDVPSSSNVDIQYDSLSDYIVNEWAGLFTSGSISLTTPVQIVPFSKDDSELEDGVEARTGVKLSFEKKDTGYKKWQDENDESAAQSKKNEKDKAETASPGAVEIVVERLSTAGGKKPLRVLVRRADIEEDTIVKEMSEEKIVHELQEAVNVWKKQGK